MKHIITLAILLCTIACSSPKEKHEQKTGVSLNVGQYLGMSHKIKIANNYLIVNDHQAETRLSLFDLDKSELKPIYTGYTGNGPNELGRDGSILIDDKRFYVFDMADMHFLSYTLDSIDVEGYKPIDKFSISEHIIMDAAMISNNTFVTTGIFLDGRFHIYNTQGDLIAKLGEYPIPASEDIPYHVSGMACLSQLTALPSKNKFAAAMVYGEHIQFYELTDSNDLKLIKEHQEFLPEFQIENQNFYSTPSTRWAYLSICSNSKFVYALYSGKYQQGGDNFLQGNEVRVFDWDGNRVNTIELDKDVNEIASTEEYLFALYENENGYEIDKYEL